VNKLGTWVKAQRLLRELDGDKELMMLVKDGIEAQLKSKPKSSEVVQYVPHNDGTLQLEYKYTSKGTRRGPYWMFRYHARGRQKTKYIGKVSLEEAKKAADDVDR
jgi:hypothetical protein